MANINPVSTARSVDTDWSVGRGVHQIVGRIVGGGTHAVTVETKLKSVLSAIVIKENSTVAVIATTIGDSTTYPGTKTVAFTVATGGEYSYIITGNVSRASTADTTGGAVTVTYEPMRRS